jgi:hypothetical protein
MYHGMMRQKILPHSQDGQRAGDGINEKIRLLLGGKNWQIWIIHDHLDGRFSPLMSNVTVTKFKFRGEQRKKINGSDFQRI